ncbi:Uncharacterised protein [Chlamydia trachomatis]|nr:Uncharacterised protein [Chlamydia trachomatis]
MKLATDPIANPEPEIHDNAHNATFGSHTRHAIVVKILEPNCIPNFEKTISTLLAPTMDQKIIVDNAIIA